MVILSSASYGTFRKYDGMVALIGQFISNEYGKSDSFFMDIHDLLECFLQNKIKRLHKFGSVFILNHLQISEICDFSKIGHN